MVEIDSECQFALQKPWLDERNQVILPLGSNLNPQPEFLTSTGKGRRMKQIEVALVNLRKTYNGIDRTESRSHGQITGALFIHTDHQIFVPRDGRICWFLACIDLFKILQSFQPL